MNRTTIEEQQTRPDQQEDRSTKRGAKKAREEREGGAEAARGLDVARLRELRDVGRNLGTQLAEQAGKRPYMALGAAAGVGFVAGSLFGSRLGQALLAAGLGYVAKNLLGGELGIERLQENIEKLAHERARG